MMNSETQADIAVEMRTYFQAKKRGTSEHRPWHQVLSDWADRIEAAAQREKVEAVTIAATKAVNLTDEKWQRDIGNAAALREALEVFIQLTDDGVIQPRAKGHHDEHCFVVAQGMARAALSAPPRNCDRFTDEVDAQLAFLNEVWLISVTRETMLERDKFDNWSVEMKAMYARWLMAPVKEGR